MIQEFVPGCEAPRALVVVEILAVGDMVIQGDLLAKVFQALEAPRAEGLLVLVVLLAMVSLELEPMDCLVLGREECQVLQKIQALRDLKT